MRAPCSCSTRASRWGNCPSTSTSWAATSSPPPDASSCAGRAAPASRTRGFGHRTARAALPRPARGPLDRRPIATRSAADARRFESWETNYAAKIGLGVAVDYALEVGIDAIEERVARSRPGSGRARRRSRRGGARPWPAALRHRDLLGRVAARGRGQPAAAGTTDQHDRSAWHEHTLLACPARPAGDLVRASVHYYNTDDELGALCDGVRRLAPDARLRSENRYGAAVRRVTDTRYAPERAWRMGSAVSSTPSGTRVGSNTRMSPSRSRSNARPVISRCAMRTRVRPSGHAAVGSSTGSSASASSSSSVNPAGRVASRSASSCWR